MRAIIHECPIPLLRILPPASLCCQQPDLSIPYCSLLQNTRIEMVDECSADVCLDEYFRLVGCKDPDSTSGIVADSRQFDKLIVNSWYLPLMFLNDYLRRVIQILPSPVVSQT